MYRFTAYPHVTHAIGTGYFQFDAVLGLAQVDVRCDFTATEVDIQHRQGPGTTLLTRLVQP